MNSDSDKLGIVQVSGRHVLFVCMLFMPQDPRLQAIHHCGFDLDNAVAKLSKQPSDFQLNVWKKLLEIPKGRVTTYGRIARSLSVRSAQAVGQAISRNPFVPDVPCHRVVNSDGSIGGYCGSLSEEHISRKLALLREEGIPFDNNRKIGKDLLFDFDDQVRC